MGKNSGDKIMRQYRGKRKDNGEWVYGDKTRFRDKTFIFSWEKGKKLIECFTKVIPETVGQSTGLEDKNDKEIWEGDKWQYGTLVFIIEFRNYRWTKRNIVTGEIFWINERFPASGGKVIGNIHDNPELETK